MNNDFENRNENMENVPNTAVPNEMPAEAVQAPEAAAAPHATENPFDDTPVQAAPKCLSRRFGQKCRSER